MAALVSKSSLSITVVYDQSQFESRQLEHYAQLAAAVLFAYDVFLTFDVEVANIWRTKWSLPKMLFIIVRYFGLFSLICGFTVSVVPHPTPEFCSPWLLFTAVASVVLVGGAINLLLLIRVYALFGRSRPILVLLGTVYVVELGLDAAINTMRAPLPVFFTDPSGVVQSGCLNWAMAPIPMLYAMQALCLSRAALYFALTLYRTLTFMSDSNSASLRELLQRAVRNLRLGPIVALFLRDEAAVFFCILVLQIVFSIFAYNASLSTYFGTVTPFLIPVLGIASTRLVLNLKETNARTRERPMSGPVSRFIVASGPGAPIELRNTDFTAQTTTIPEFDVFDSASLRRKSYDALVANHSQAEDEVIDIKPEPNRRVRYSLDADEAEGEEETGFRR